MLAVSLEVPPRRAVVTHQHQRARVHVTHNTLTRRDRSRELMLDRMTGRLVVSRLFQGSIVGLRGAVVSKLRVRPRVKLIAIVRINHVTGSASAGAIIPR